MVLIEGIQKIRPDMWKFEPHEIVMRLLKEVNQAFSLFRFYVIYVSCQDKIHYEQEQFRVDSRLMANFSYRFVSESERNRESAQYGQNIEIAVDKVNQRIVGSENGMIHGTV